MFLALILVFGAYYCAVNWKLRTDAKNKAEIAMELNKMEEEMQREAPVGLDDSVISFQGPDGKKKTRHKRIVGGIDYMYDIDSSGNYIGSKRSEVGIK